MSTNKEKIPAGDKDAPALATPALEVKPVSPSLEVPAEVPANHAEKLPTEILPEKDLVVEASSDVVQVSQDTVVAVDAVAPVDSAPQGNPKKGKRPGKNPFGERGKDGAKMDRKVRTNVIGDYQRLKSRISTKKFPLKVSIMGDLGATASLQFLPTYDADISFLYDHVEFGMVPLRDGPARSADLAVLISRHFEYVFASDEILNRIEKLKKLLTNAGVDVHKIYEENTRTVDIDVSSPHVLSFFSAVKSADEIVVLNNVAWITGLIDRKEMASQHYSLVRLIEKEFNFINKIARVCRERRRWSPFPALEGVRQRMIADDLKKENLKNKQAAASVNVKEKAPVAGSKPNGQQQQNAGVLPDPMLSEKKSVVVPESEKPSVVISEDVDLGMELFD